MPKKSANAYDFKAFFAPRLRERRRTPFIPITLILGGEIDVDLSEGSDSGAR